MFTPPPAVHALNLTLSVALSFAAAAASADQSAAPGFDPTSAPITRPILSDGLPDMSEFPPVYIYKDKAGQDYTIEVPTQPGDETGRGNALRKRLLTGQDRALLARTKAKVQYLPDLGLEDGAAGQTKTGCTATVPPTSFTIMGSGGPNSVGSIGICNMSPGKPANAHTQWLQFVVGTLRVKSNQVHVPVIAWFAPDLRGHGMYFGDTSASPCTNNGEPSNYNTRIEAWSQWVGHNTSPPVSPWWQSTGYTYTDTCGARWQDAFQQMEGQVYDTRIRYRITLHATDEQAVMYSVDKKSMGVWQTHTPPVWKNVTYATSWPQYPTVFGYFDPSANGVAIIGIPVSGTVGSWFVQVTGLSTGWF